MKKLALFITSLICITGINAQCTYPVSLNQKIKKSVHIVLGTVVTKESFTDQETGNIYTLNKIKITAWLKGYEQSREVAVITEGGVVGNNAMVVTPSLQLQAGKEYILFLESNNYKKDNKSFRRTNPGIIQALVYADEQGALLNLNGHYTGLHTSTKMNEKKLFEEIQSVTGETARTPSNLPFRARTTTEVNISAKTAAVSSFAPTTTNAGTIVPGDFVTISGAGFGASPGTVAFANGDDGGATTITPPVSSDYVSWSDGSITVKVPSNAGTGNFIVNGTFTSPSPLTVNYSHTNINSTFFNFSTSTRQRYYLRNMNGAGGYDFLYNTGGFSANTSATAAFQRALSNWKTNTLINWRVNGTTPNGFASDNVNVVMFDATLPSGVLGRTTSRFTGGAIPGTCEQANTVWCVYEIDVQFTPDPPVPGFTWQFGPSAPSSSQFDFESVALHELGHAHGLGHIINLGKVMHYALSNGSSIRTLSANDINAGTAKMSYSTSATCFNATGCGSGPMVLATLPLRIITFNGEWMDFNKNKLRWETGYADDVKAFIVQKSNDGRQFYDAASVARTGNQTKFSYIDYDTRGIDWYYRIKQINLDGNFDYSNTVFIKNKQTEKSKIWIGSGDRLNVYIRNANVSIFSLKLYNITGQLITESKINSNYSSLKLPSLSTGIYYYSISNGSENYSGKLFYGEQ
ncbi:MAG: matrixin family metalloprotease [Sphingobacteriales bacterium]|nr:MAG: matrixin family metalloprotease [Sphingobacteriales bacterium]